jgi:predicted helicase
LGGQTGKSFGVSAENAARIRKQNEKKISVIIGNPPYNAKQANYNYQNANRAYKEIDKRIKDTYIEHGSAQNQIVLYDMYVRFFRWATDRIQNEGIIAFVSNNSFVDGKTFDGFRKLAAQEFSEIYIINLKGNARTSGERRRQEGGNVFSDDIRVGVAVYFFIKRKTIERCKIYYDEIRDYAKADEKKAYLTENRLETLPFTHITPDKDFNWIRQSENEWENLLPLIDKEAKAGKRFNVIFQSFSYGFDTKADDFMFDFSNSNLSKKIKHFIEIFNLVSHEKNHQRKFEIKWSRNVEKRATRGLIKIFDDQKIVSSLYRPYTKKFLYFDKDLIAETFQWFNITDINQPNSFLCLSGLSASKPFQILISEFVSCGDFLEKTQCLPLYRYTKEGHRIDNITDWALQQFQNYYKQKEPFSPVCYAGSSELREEYKLDIDTTINITKQNIFHYVYAVLHHPAFLFMIIFFNGQNGENN